MENKTDPQDKARYVRKMFGAIAGRYDLMNRLMTGGRDGDWRREAVALVDLPPGGRALDVGTGTGDFLPLLASTAPDVEAIGVDFTWEMLAAGRYKLATYGNRTLFAAADALALPFGDNTFDAVVNGFLLRNVADLRTALAEMARVTRSRGTRWFAWRSRTPPFPYSAIFSASTFTTWCRTSEASSADGRRHTTTCRNRWTAS